VARLLVLLHRVQSWQWVTWVMGQYPWPSDPWPINRWLSHSHFKNHFHLQAQSEYRALADISRSRSVVTATKPVHRLQIRPIVHN